MGGFWPRWPSLLLEVAALWPGVGHAARRQGGRSEGKADAERREVSADGGHHEADAGGHEPFERGADAHEVS